MRRWLCAVLGAFLLVVAGAGIAPAPATAATGYCTGPGINVVVDFGALGGGLERGCVAGSGGRSAASAFAAAGVSLSRVSRFPGAICKVEGRPSTSCTNMPPGDAYWGLFSSHGNGWTFSSQGVDSLRLSAGDTVAFAWQTSSRHAPATAPAAPAKASPTPRPTSSGGKTAGSHSSKPSVAALPTSSSPGSTKASGTAHRHASASPSSSSSPTATSTISGSDAYSSDLTIQKDDSAQSDDSGGLPWWVPVGIVAVLAAGGAGVVVVRRRTGSGAG